MIILERLKSILQTKTRCHILYCKNNSLIKESFITIINFKKEKTFLRIKLSLKYFWYFLLSFPLIHKFQLRLQQKEKTKTRKNKKQTQTEFKKKKEHAKIIINENRHFINNSQKQNLPQFKKLRNAKF